MKFTMTVDMSNAAFADPGELTRIIREVARRPEEGERYGDLKDINGNIVGTWKVR